MKTTNWLLAVIAAAALGNAAQGAKSPKDEGLIADWSFDDGKGETAKDASGNKYDLALSGPKWVKDGKVGGAIQFDGTRECGATVDLSGVPAPKAISVEAWVNPSALPSDWALIFNWEKVIQFRINAPNEGNFLAAFMCLPDLEPRAQNPDLLPLNTWSHLVATWNGSTVALYVNGEQVGESDHAGKVQNPAMVGIGDGFVGQMDELKVFNRALTAKEVKARYVAIYPLEAQLARGQRRWDMSAESAKDFTVKGAVQLGVTVDGGGSAARFDGGSLVSKDAAVLLKDCPEFTLAVRLKPDAPVLFGTVMIQQGPMTADSGAFDLSGWAMPFMERNHFGFHGMITGGLEGNSSSQFSTVNMNFGDTKTAGWHDVVIARKKGGALTLYFDGKAVSSRTGLSWTMQDKMAFDGPASPLVFGAEPDGSNPFRGLIDYAAFWNRKLTASELAALGIKEPATAPAKPPLGSIGTGIFSDKTSMAERYDWLDAKTPAFLAHLLKTDPNLPRYHIALPGEFWNPNAFFHNGRYHLFISFTAGGNFRFFNDSYENIIWQHLVSDDLITWTILPMPIRHPFAPNENGTFFVNDNGEAVVFYYGDYDSGWRPRMAVSRDPDLVKWEFRPDKLTVNGVPPELQLRHDPSAVFKRGDQWYMTAGTVRWTAKDGTLLPLYRAKNSELTEWDYAGTFYKDATGYTIIECGQLFPLGGKWVFTIIEKLSMAGTCMTGELTDDGTFKKVWCGVTDFGTPDYDCVSTAVDGNGRATLWRWLPSVRSFAQASRDGWWNCYTIPRDLRLAENGQLLVRPDPRLEKLRGQPVSLDKLNAASSEIRLRFAADDIGETGIHLTDGKNSIEAFYDHAKMKIVMDYRKLDWDLTSRRGVYRAPVTVKPGETVTLRFFSDRSIFELYANDEVVISQAGFFHDPENLKAATFSRKGSKAEINVEAWEMSPLKWETYGAKK